jgi:hypothetical protein
MLHNLKGVAAMTDPKDTTDTQTPDDELPEAELDAVAGGSTPPWRFPRDGAIFVDLSGK